MADTLRTIAALQTLLADNTSGNISPQDLRDMLVSLGDMNLQHQTTGWKDMLSPLSAAGVPTSNAPTMTAFGPSGKREELAFAVNDYCFPLPFHVNHDVKVNGDAYVHVHWTTNGTSTNTVKWEMEITRSLGHGQAAFGAPITVSVEQAASGTAWQHMVAEVSVSDKLVLTEPDELILVTLTRVTNGATDNSDTVFGLLCDLHYESDRDATLNKAPNFFA